MEEDVGSLPLVEGGCSWATSPVATIVVRGIARRRPVSASVPEVCSRELESVQPDEPLDVALLEMAREQVRAGRR